MKYLLLFMISEFSTVGFSQEKESIKDSNISYYGRKHFLIEGRPLLTL